VPGKRFPPLDFWILLDGVIGKESTNTWCRGVLQVPVAPAGTWLWSPLVIAGLAE
jgi:hypothetical protein